MSEALAVWCALVLEDGRRLGDAADRLQRSDAAAVLAPSEPRRHWLGRTRGYAKTSDAAAMTLAAMLTDAPPGARMYVGAGDRDQARLSLDSLHGFVTRTPEIGSALSVDTWKATTREGVVLEMLSADAASAFGLRPWWLVIDELAQWADTPQSRRFYEALSTALPKVTGSRLVITTTAGDPTHFAHKVYEAACAEQALWRVSEHREVAPWIALGLIEAEQRRLPASAFARYWRNEWSQSEDAALEVADVTACVERRGALDPRPGVRYVVTVDLGWRGDATAICVAHRERSSAADRIVVDRVDRITGTREREVDLDAVEDRVLALARRYRARVFVDPAQAIGMMQRLRRRGVRVEEHTFSASSNTHLALRLLELVRSRRLGLPDDDALVDELCSVRIVERGPGLFRLDSSPGQHDDMAVVVGMACVHLDAGVRGGRAGFAVARGWVDGRDLRTDERGAAGVRVARVGRSAGMAVAWGPTRRR
jgi:hypothetical protein